jgi:hypothetical protein
MASSFDSARMIAKPPINSLASANGPSMTLTVPRDARRIAPFELGSSPAVETTTPAFIISSVCFPIAAISRGSGGSPAS